MTPVLYVFTEEYGFITDSFILTVSYVLCSMFVRSKQNNLTGLESILSRCVHLVDCDLTSW